MKGFKRFMTDEIEIDHLGIHFSCKSGSVQIAGLFWLDSLLSQTSVAMIAQLSE